MIRTLRYRLFLCLLASAVAFPTALNAEQKSFPVARGNIIRDYARVTFEWPRPVDFTASTKGNSVSITFDQKANPDFGRLLASLHPYITHAQRKSDGKTIVLTLDKPYKIRTFMGERQAGIDILGIDPKANKQLAKHEKQEPKTPAPQIASKPQPAAQQQASRQAAELAKLAPAVRGAASVTPPPAPSPAPTTAAEAPPPPAEKKTEPKVEPAPSPAAEKKPETAPTPSTAEPGDSEHLQNAQTKPADIPDTINKVTIFAADDSATLRIPLATRTALAVFARNHHLWVVIGKPIKLDLSEFDSMAKTVVGKPQIIANSKATILYIPMDDNVYANVLKEDGSERWVIMLTQKKTAPKSPVDVIVNTAPPLPPHVFVGALEMIEPIAVRDPLVGDVMVITPLFNASEAIAHPRSFIEFSLLATSQGIVVEKKADDVSVVQLRNGLRISTTKGASISADLPKLEKQESADGLQANPTLFPYDLWKIDDYAERKKKINELFHKIVKSDNAQDANNARIRMAQIYLSEGMAAEAIALLDGINRTHASFYRSAKLNALRGTANFLMYRFIDAARDFSAAELNNNKEVEYWRSVLSDLLGNPGKTHDYLAMNQDYISKYPPIFRQRLAIVAADRAIAAKEYNIALKIFDTLHQDNLLDSINAYINFLMAKISVSTGQEKEANESLDKLAQDVKHPFVQARAEFTRIARDMDAGLDKNKAIDRLARLRISWHGDNLELQVLTLLGELYYEKGDYVNAMRVWNNGVQAFQNTATAIDMNRKMEETFVIMFNDGVADKLPPLEALALYYEYRNYMPNGTAGNEMLNRLSDRLIAVDLLDQAATLLDHQMRTQTEKERRSRVGAKLAAVHLMNHQPEKALGVLQDSVYGENPVLLRLQRNQLTADAMVELGQYDKALQTLGQDDSMDAERIRISVYWKGRDWAKLTASIENMLKNRQDITAPVTLDESEHLLQLALAYIFENNREQLQYLHDYFTPLMSGNPNKDVFEFITTSDIVPNSRNFDDVITTLSNTRSFIENYKARIKIAAEAPAPAAEKQ